MCRSLGWSDELPNEAASTVVLQHDRVPLLARKDQLQFSDSTVYCRMIVDGLAPLRLKIIEGRRCGMPSLIEAFER